jgi:hypothetical protein
MTYIVSAPPSSKPLAGTSTGASVVGPFWPDAESPIHLSLSGTISGTVRVLRSVDGGTTRLPLTIGGSPWASYTSAVNEPVWEEAVSGVALYLDIPNAGVVYRMEQ